MDAAASAARARIEVRVFMGISCGERVLSGGGSSSPSHHRGFDAFFPQTRCPRKDPVSACHTGCRVDTLGRGAIADLDRHDFRRVPMIDRRRFLATAASPLLAAVVSTVGPALEASATTAAPIDLAPTLEQVRRRFGLPAVGAIAVSTDRVIARGVAGVRRMGEPGAVPPDAHWQLGSLSKNFTGTLAALLVERGLLSWDTTLRQIYPEHV